MEIVSITECQGEINKKALEENSLFGKRKSL